MSLTVSKLLHVVNRDHAPVIRWTARGLTISASTLAAVPSSVKRVPSGYYFVVICIVNRTPFVGQEFGLIAG